MMMTCSPGEIVVVRFPFSNHQIAKRRPALVVSPENYAYLGDVVLLAITSVPQNTNQLQIKHWKEAGLLKPSWVKPTLGTFHTDIVAKKLGNLNPVDHGAARSAIGMAIQSEYLAT